MTTTRTRKFLWSLLALLVLIGVAAFALIWRPALEPVDRAKLEPVAETTMTRGGEIAAAGMCVVCHTTDGGQRNAGGRAMDTPFGTIYSTNITPDAQTGIGSWSFEAFDRAMRKGIDREGRHLYPAFPYTAFTHMTAEDMRALYGYLMTQPAVQNEPPATKLPFPFNMRGLMAGWNLLFLRQGEIKAEPDESEQWNRGNYLARALAHCSACHSPRNSLGAEKKGDDYFAGGDAEGWHAHALNRDSRAPVAWTEDELFAYLRGGYSAQHGPAGGTMAPVVREGTSKISEADTRALAAYVASFMTPGDGKGDKPRDTQALDDKAMATLHPARSAGASLYQGACLACHGGGEDAPMFGKQPPLWLNTNLHADTPDNLIRVVLEGVQAPAFAENGYMPGFGNSLNDTQVIALVRYMREEMAGLRGWEKLDESVARIRGENHMR